MKQQILVPLDGSAVAEAVLPHAERFARITGSTITLLHVVTDVERSQTQFWVAAAPAELRRQWEQAALTHIHSYLAAVASRLQAAGLSIQTEVPMADDAAAAIVARADRDPGVVLVAMATHGRSGLGRWVFGSVAAQVLRVAPKPVLVVRAGEDPVCDAATDPYRSIVIPLDGSTLAERALAQVRTIPAIGEASLVLVGVTATSDDRDLAGSGVDAPRIALARDGEAGMLPDYLRQTAQQLEAEGLVVRWRMMTGAPAEAILRVSAEEHADLIVMATHGRSGLSHLVLGSVAEEIVRHTDVPVMLVRPLVDQELAASAPDTQSRPAP